MNEELRRECVRRISAGGSQLTRLIAELLDFGRIEQGNLSLEVAPCSLSDLVAQTVRDLAGVLERHLVEVDVPADMQVLANRDGLVRVLDNLLTNAVKFSPAGSQIRVRGRTRGPEQIVVEVEDEGIGIPPEDAGRVFDRFPPPAPGALVAFRHRYRPRHRQGVRRGAGRPCVGVGQLLRRRPAELSLWAPGHLPGSREVGGVARTLGGRANG